MTAMVWNQLNKARRHICAQTFSNISLALIHRPIHTA